MKFYFAPMEGITGYVFRRIHHRYFPGIDAYFSPFISPDSTCSMNPRERRDILPEHNEGYDLVPQILANNAEYFSNTAEVLKGYGYRKINLNLGCPSGTVVSKKKGSGMLGDTDLLAEFLEGIYEKNPDLEISLKTRIGKDSVEEFPELLKIYSWYPVSELIVHPRIRKDFYKGKPDLETFALALQEPFCSVCYNGDICRVEDYKKITESYPELSAVMIGRGLLINPALVREIQTGQKLEKQEFHEFIRAIYAGYKEALLKEAGAKTVLFKMKELWGYFGLAFEENKKPLKMIRKSQNLEEYEEGVRKIFAEVPLLDA